MQNQSKREITFDTQLKTALYIAINLFGVFWVMYLLDKGQFSRSKVRQVTKSHG